MIVYLISCIASAMIMYLSFQKPEYKNHKWYIIIFSAIPMILVAALRYDVGQDYLYTYVPYYEMVQNNLVPTNQRMEIIYHGLNVIAAGLHSGAASVFAVCAVLFYLFVYAYIVEESPMPVLSVFLLTGMGYVFVFFNAMRQMVGCAILLYALRYVKNRRFIPFVICVLFAAGFHVSCLFFVISYFLPEIRIKPVYAFILTAIIVILNGMIAVAARSIIALSRYGIYISSIFDTGNTAYIYLCVNLIIMIFLSICYRQERQFQLFYNIQMIALWITFFSGSIVLSLRILWIFGLPSIISVPMGLQSFSKERDRKLGASAVVILYFLYTLYTVGIQNSNNVLPYQTIIGRWL